MNLTVSPRYLTSMRNNAGNILYQHFQTGRLSNMLIMNNNDLIITFELKVIVFFFTITWYHFGDTLFWKKTFCFKSSSLQPIPCSLLSNLYSSLPASALFYSLPSIPYFYAVLSRYVLNSRRATALALRSTLYVRRAVHRQPVFRSKDSQSRPTKQSWNLNMFV